MASLVTRTSATIAQDVSRLVNDIEPKKYPIQTALSKRNVKDRYAEVLNYELRAVAANNAQVEGADATDGTLHRPTRSGNYVQEIRGVVNVSDASRYVDSLGYKDELGFQMTQEATALKKELETYLVGNHGSRPEDGTNPGTFAGMESIIKTAVSHGAGGSTAGFNTTTRITAAPVDGTLRELTEEMVLDTLQISAEEGGEPDKIMCGADLKKTISRFTGDAVRQVDAGDKKVTKSVTTIESDFGLYNVIYHRQMRPTVVIAYDESLWQLGVLHNWAQKDLPANGSFERKQINGYFTLLCLNEKGNAKIADVTKPA